MIIFLLIVIALLLWLIYLHITKEDRAKAKFERYMAKELREHRTREGLELDGSPMDVEMPKEDLADQIEKYHKVHKTWNWRK